MYAAPEYSNKIRAAPITRAELDSLSMAQIVVARQLLAELSSLLATECGCLSDLLKTA